MRLHITTKNMELSDEIRDYVEEKIGELDKFISYPGESEKGKSPIEAWVEIGRTSFHHKKGEICKAEVILFLGGKKLVAESKTEDLKTSITEVKDELQRELKKYKGKVETKNKKGRRLMKKLMNLSPLARFKRKREE